MSGSRDFTQNLMSQKPPLTTTLHCVRACVRAYLRAYMSTCVRACVCAWVLTLRNNEEIAFSLVFLCPTLTTSSGSPIQRRVAVCTNVIYSKQTTCEGLEVANTPVMIIAHGELQEDTYNYHTGRCYILSAKGNLARPLSYYFVFNSYRTFC